MHAPSTVDVPFRPPLDIELDLPPPPSVNRVWMRAKSGKRQVFTAPAYTAWKRAADNLIGMTAQMRGVKPILGPFEIIVILCERQNRIDADNALKVLCDYCVRLCLVPDDSPKYMRRVVVEWGDAPHGCRVILRPREPN